MLAQEAKIECHGGHSQAGLMTDLVLLQAFKCFHFLFHDLEHVLEAVPGHKYGLDRSRFQRIQPSVWIAATWSRRLLYRSSLHVGLFRVELGASLVWRPGRQWP